MEILKPLFIILFIAVICILTFIGRSLMVEYKRRLIENPSYRKIKTMLTNQAQIVEQSDYRTEIRETVASSYLYILELIQISKDPDLHTLTPCIDIVNHPILRDVILPYLNDQVYHDIESLDKIIIKIIEYYNDEMEDIVSLAQLLILIIGTTPPSLYGNDKRITDLIYY